MSGRALVILVLAAIVHARSAVLSPAWNGLWAENPSRSSIFVPGSLTIERGRRGFVLLEGAGSRTLLTCVSGSPATSSCRELTGPTAAAGHGLPFGDDYRLSAGASHLEADHWRMVPDGSRLTDSDFYERRGTGDGFAGRWKKTHSTEAPTVYRVAIDGDRMTFVEPDGEVNVHFSLRAASTRAGSPYVLTPAARNVYTILGPFAILERSYFRGALTGRSVITLSADGQRMREDHTDFGPPRSAVHIVYDRSRS